MKQTLITWFKYLVLIAIIVGIYKYVTKETKYERPTYDYVATVYHSVMESQDKGVEYFYYIYKTENNDNTFFYIKSKNTISAEGSGKEKDIDSGSLKEKKDLNKIIKDIDKDSNRELESNISYTYLNEGNNEECASMEELADKIF